MLTLFANTVHRIVEATLEANTFHSRQTKRQLEEELHVKYAEPERFAHRSMTTYGLCLGAEKCGCHIVDSAHIHKHVSTKLVCVFPCHFGAKTEKFIFETQLLPTKFNIHLCDSSNSV